jgi:hypothetical protein
MIIFASCADVNNTNNTKMVAHNIESRDGATTSTTAEAYKSFPSDAVTMDDITATKYGADRLGSIPYDEMRQDAASLPGLAPVSPCFSEDSSVASSSPRSITGRYTDVEAKYRVDPRILGTGHHGSVRMCTDRSTGRRLAVKSIRKTDPVVDEDALSREIQLLSEARHRNVVRLVDLHEDAEYLHLVTDLCSGGELYDRIVQRSEEENGMPCFAEDEAARIVHQILTAVACLHRRGIVHRDVKPENILFESTRPNSPIKIVDFGLAAKHYSGLEPPMNQVVGTPYYIAPEVLKRKYDASCDLWSVGVIAYILMCGYPPFNGADNREVYNAVRKGRYRFPSHDWSRTSRESRDFIRKLLQKDPRKRMMAEEALRHPWIARHAANSSNESRRDVHMASPAGVEERDEDWSIEVVFGGVAEDDSVLCEDGVDRYTTMRGAPLLPDLP